jgi:hypothetical protein
MMFLGCCRPNFIALDSKLIAGGQQKARNPVCICLVMNVPYYYSSQKHSPKRKIWVLIDFFKTKKLLKALRYQIKLFKSTLDRGLAFAKKIPAIVNLWVINMDGKDY